MIEFITVLRNKQKILLQFCSWFLPDEDTITRGVLLHEDITS